MTDQSTPTPTYPIPAAPEEVRVERAISTPIHGSFNQVTKSQAPPASAIAGMRADWLANFNETVGRNANIQPSELATLRAAHMRRFDEAAAVDGYSVHVLDPADAARARAHGFDPNTPVTPDMYSPAYSQAANLPPAVLAAAIRGGGEVAAAFQLPPAVGEAVLERISSLGQQTAALSEDQRHTWFTVPCVALLIGEQHYSANALVKSGHFGAVRERQGAGSGAWRYVQVAAVEKYLGRKLTPIQIGFLKAQHHAHPRAAKELAVPRSSLMIKA